MNIIAILLFVLSASIDNFTVAVAYGMKKIKIGMISYLIISIISALGTGISMTFGSFFYHFISLFYAKLIGCFILTIIGLYFIYDYRLNKNSLQSKTKDESITPKEILHSPEIADLDKSGTIEVKESLALGVALAIDNFGLGIAASIVGLNILYTTLITLLFNILIIPLGVYIAKSYISSFVGKNASLISGIVIISLAIIQFFLK